MTEPQAIRFACLIQALVSRTSGDYSAPNDGFCEVCPNHGEQFRSSGQSLTYVLGAVIERLVREGHLPDAAVLEEIRAFRQEVGL